MLSDQMYGDTGDDLPELSDESDDEAIGEMVGNALGRWRRVADVFHSYYGFCKRKDFGIRTNLNRSYLKLNSPDKRRYGGGVRVEKIVIVR